MIVVQVPLRISFFGGGTDLSSFYHLESGAVLSSAIDKYVYAIVKERFDQLICVNYSKKEIVTDIDDLEHGLVREAMRMTGVCRGVEITTLADVPSEGSGLGSSSSITVALLLALFTYQGVLPSAEQLAEAACRIEIDILKKPIGKQDQYIAAVGGMHLFEFLCDGSVQFRRVELENGTKPRLSSRLLLFFTNRTRSADSILQEQSLLNAHRLVTLAEMKGQVQRANALLEAGELDAFGALLHEGWELKRQLVSGITDATIDEMYERAREAGALGGKIAGAGGGGFLLLYCPPEHQDAVRAALHDYPELPFQLDRDGAKVVLNLRR